MDLKGAEIRNILELCNDIGSTERKPLLVNIPHYQRPYKWDEARIKSLISDFQKNREEGPQDSSYFVGSVVLVNGTHESGSRCEVIDGQQRITTVFLLNYIRFLLLRAQTEDNFYCKSIGTISDSIEQLKSSYATLLGNNGKETELTELKIAVQKAANEMVKGDKNLEDAWSSLLAQYQGIVSLPPREFDEDYGVLYKEALLSFFQSNHLALRYSRESYNKKLCEALSSIILTATISTHPTIRVEYDGEDPVVLQYLNAIQFEFDALIDNGAVEPNASPEDASRNLISYIETMLDSIEFCVVLTGNEKDAYTLFEVLNDRAMEVDDLDLIKNLFLRQYCNKSGETDSEIDKTVCEIDELWGEQVFKPGITQTRIKMISLLGATYLTGDSNISGKKMEKYREVIEEKYLDALYNSGSKPYTSQLIRRDISIYQMIGIIIEKYQLPAKKKETHAFMAEIEASKSITYKALHLLNALNQDGVIASLVNLIIRSFMDSDEFSKTQSLDIESFTAFLSELESKDSHSKTEFKTINKWAFELWKAALLSNGYEVPRSIAKRIIESVSVFGNKINTVYISDEERTEMKEGFKTWTSNWRYDKSEAAKLKARILFCELINCHRDDSGTTLKYATIHMSVDSEKMELDHLDAQNPNPTMLEAYYTPEDPNAQREDVINSLGNIMILASEENNGKGNKPLEDALEYYSNMCPSGHWLIDEIKTTLMIEGNSRMVPLGDRSLHVPTDQFFTSRKKQLREYFYAVLSRSSLEDKDISIVSL